MATVRESLDALREKWIGSLWKKSCTTSLIALLMIFTLTHYFLPQIQLKTSWISPSTLLMKRFCVITRFNSTILECRTSDMD